MSTYAISRRQGFHDFLNVLLDILSPLFLFLTEERAGRKAEAPQPVPIPAPTASAPEDDQETPLEIEVPIVTREEAESLRAELVALASQGDDGLPATLYGFPVVVEAEAVADEPFIAGPMDVPADWATRFAPPPTATTAEPGTPEKLAVMLARAKAGQRLWHPDDAEQQAEPLYVRKGEGKGARYVPAGEGDDGQRFRRTAVGSRTKYVAI